MMLPHSSKISQNNNGNARKTNRRNDDQSSSRESACSSHDSESSSQDKNRNSRSKKKSHRTSDPHTAEPSRINCVYPILDEYFRRRPHLLYSARSTIASEEVITTGEMKELRREAIPITSESDDSKIEREIMRTLHLLDSESGTSDNEEVITPGEIVELRREAIPITSGSDDSKVQRAIMRRPHLLDSERSTSASGEVITPGCSTTCPVDRSTFDSMKSDVPLLDTIDEVLAIMRRSDLLDSESSTSDSEEVIRTRSSTTCPVDRSTFNSIGSVVPLPDIDEMLLNDAVKCEICGSEDDKEMLLLCDFCVLGYHVACFGSSLSASSAGAWYCPMCTNILCAPIIDITEAALNWLPTSYEFLHANGFSYSAMIDKQLTYTEEPTNGMEKML